jgi:hypothetical protein
MAILYASSSFSQRINLLVFSTIFAQKLRRVQEIGGNAK